MKMGMMAIVHGIMVRSELVGFVTGLQGECICIHLSRDWLSDKYQAPSTTETQGHICVICGANGWDSGIQMCNTQGHRCAVSWTGV